MNSRANEYIAAWAAPEILEGLGKTAPQADVFAFSMVVIEVCPRPLPHLVLEVDGRIVCLTSELRLRFLREGIHSVNSQTRSLLQRLWMAVGRLARRRRKNLVLRTQYGRWRSVVGTRTLLGDQR